jgi:RNA polymerase sigma-70 factor (ECF subfamily)
MSGHGTSVKSWNNRQNTGTDRGAAAMAAGFEDTLARSRAGDRDALESLFAPWRPLLRLQAQQLLGPALAGRVDPSDVVQEALAQAYAGLGQFRGADEGTWLAWLRAIVAGHAAKACRHHLAARRHPGREGGGCADQVPDARATAPDDVLLGREEAARLAVALDTLTGPMREVVVRRAFHGEPFGQVAEALGRSEGAARVLWVRALRRLRQALDEAAPEDDS